jgi:hypothetical protein
MSVSPTPKFGQIFRVNFSVLEPEKIKVLRRKDNSASC